MIEVISAIVHSPFLLFILAVLISAPIILLIFEPKK